MLSRSGKSAGSSGSGIATPRNPLNQVMNFTTEKLFYTPCLITCFDLSITADRPPNGLRYWGAGAGVDSVWEQEKLEARKMLENAAESPASSACFVGLCLFGIRVLPIKFHLSCSFNSQVLTFKACDKIKTHIYASRNTSRCNYSTSIYPSCLGLNINVREHRTQIGYVFPMCSCILAAK